MAGHSHAKNVARRKDAVNAKRAKVFTKLCRDIYVAAKQFGEESPQLKTLLEKARKMSLPKENIERAIKKATDPNASDDMQDIVYEGFIFDGIALIIEVCTDNKNRSAADVRAILSKAGGDLGACAYLFEKRGVLVCDKKSVDFDELLSKAIDHGADDVQEQENNFFVLCSTEKIHDLHLIFKEACVESRIEYVPFVLIELTSEQQEKYIKVINSLNDLDDVIEIYSNADYKFE